MTRLWVRRLFHVHSPALLMMGKDPIVSARAAKRCQICRDVLTPVTPEQLAQMMATAAARYDLPAMLGDSDD